MSNPQSERRTPRFKAVARALADDVTTLIEQAGTEELEGIRREIRARVGWVRFRSDGKKKQTAPTLSPLERLKRRGRAISPAAGDPDAEAAFEAPSEARSEPVAAEDQFDGILSARAMAQVLRMSKPTLFKQMRAGQLVGWLDQRNRGCFPAGQLDRFGRVTPGIPQILEQFSDPMVAWWWLTGSRHSLEDRAPLELLQSDEVERAIDAARGYAMGAFG